jgi:hypothetical protein
MRAGAADSVQAVVQAREQHRDAVDMSGQYAIQRHAGERYALPEVWTWRRRVALCHGGSFADDVESRVARLPKARHGRGVVPEL